MVGSPVVPRVLSVPGSSVSLTVMARLIFEWPGLRKDLRIFENGVGAPIDRLHHPEKGRQAFEGRWGSTGCIKAQPVASVCIGGDGGGWVYGGLGLHLGVVGDGGGRCPLFISQTVSSIFGGCLWPDRSGSELDVGIVHLSTGQSHPRTALDNLL